jgi:predicted transposase YdaD
MQSGMRKGLRQGIQLGVQRGRQEGVQEGLQQGLQQGMQQIALTALNQGYSPDEVSILTGLILEQIKKLSR